MPRVRILMRKMMERMQKVLVRRLYIHILMRKDPIRWPAVPIHMLRDMKLAHMLDIRIQKAVKRVHLNHMHMLKVLQHRLTVIAHIPRVKVQGRTVLIPMRKVALLLPVQATCMSSDE